MNRRLPNFLVIGAQKCGTTWLHHHLSAHPQIFLPPDKDQAHFFFREDREKPPPGDYERQFAAATAEQLAIGETTAAYFWTRTASPWDLKPANAEADLPARVRAELGARARFVLSLRDPVERAVSAYLHYLAHGELSAETSLMEAAAYSGLVDIGFYARHLSNWLAHYGREQILVLSLEQDVRAAPRSALQRVFEFLQVDSRHVPRAVEHPVFAGRSRHWRDDGVWVTGGDGKERLLVAASTIAELRAIYRSDTQQLGKMLGGDFIASWKSGWPVT